MAPVSGDEVDTQSPAFSHLPPEHSKVASLNHEHLIARRQGVHDRCLPGTSTRGRIDDDRLISLEDRSAAFQYFHAEFSKFRAAVINYLLVHGAEHSLGDRAWPGDLKKMVSVF